MVAGVLAATCIVGVGIWGVASARNATGSVDTTLFLVKKGHDGSAQGLDQETAISPGTRPESAGPLPASSAPAGVSTSTTAAIFVQVVGAVECPGVYQLPRGSRVFQAVAAAGGARPDADLEAINMASLVADGARIVVPRVGDQTGAGTAGVGPTGVSASESHMVSLNSADVRALESLPGIGPSLAAAIIAYREEHGPFQSVEELVKVPGIGPATLAKIRDLVVP